jgi:hypothetical protein
MGINESVCSFYGLISRILKMIKCDGSGNKCEGVTLVLVRHYRRIYFSELAEPLKISMVKNISEIEHSSGKVTSSNHTLPLR